MQSGVLTFILNNWPVLSFYGGIILLLIIFRKKFTIQSKIIALYRTKVGLNAMRKYGKKYSETIKIIAYCGIGVGFIGLVFILLTLIENLYKLITTPTVQSGISLIIPGVNIPGSPITPPLIIGWIALFVVIVVHEFSHGLVSIAHGIKVKSSGIVFFGPLMGAFVEPDEKQLEKKHETAQYSVFAAGPFSNILLALFAIFFMSWILSPTIGSLTEPIGFTIENIQEGYPAEAANLPTNTLITSINGNEVNSAQDFIKVMKKVDPGDTIIVGADKDYSIITTENPKNSESPYIGIIGLKNEIKPKYPGLISSYLVSFLKIIQELFSWIGLLSLGIGLANLLPLGPVDGGRMTLLAMQQIKGMTKGKIAWARISMIALILLLLNIFWPAFSWLGNLI